MTIVQNSAGQTFRVREPADADLSHCWLATPVKRVRGEWVNAKGLERLERKLGCTPVPA